MWWICIYIDCLLFLAPLFRSQLQCVYLLLFTVFENMLLILKIVNQPECAGVMFLKDGDLKLKEVREKIVEEKSYRNIFSFLVPQHCYVRKTGSCDES